MRYKIKKVEYADKKVLFFAYYFKGHGNIGWYELSPEYGGYLTRDAAMEEVRRHRDYELSKQVVGEDEEFFKLP